ncbi:MAG TPA: glycosyltransferase [Candidatus Angelobacter sp.]|jgi:glycosyltransferase involved in cell wall biosynthesis|nr:glycosyltransferase [Candidatus Angelobacter sp.]
METDRAKRTVDVIIPARNEEDCLGRCLQSLVAQQGISFQITVVDDGSTDRTRAIAESFPGVRVLSAGELKPGMTGKVNALVTGAAGSSAEWLLFTDADTFHYPGSLAASVREAEERKVDLLSYSPEQETNSWWELAVMPLVFADLVRTYSSERINDPADPSVAANGQYILVRREVYEALGGHSVLPLNVLEDIELAKIFKVSGHRIWFRYGAGIVRTRMYRTFGAMWEGWSKGLAILFRRPVLLAARRALEFIAIAVLLTSGLVMMAQHHVGGGAALFAGGTFLYLTFLFRIRQAHFPWKANLMAFLGLPIYVSLLLRSNLHFNRRGELTWKGRTYSQSAPKAAVDSSIRKDDLR